MKEVKGRRIWAVSTLDGGPSFTSQVHNARAEPTEALPDNKQGTNTRTRVTAGPRSLRGTVPLQSTPFPPKASVLLRHFLPQNTFFSVPPGNSLHPRQEPAHWNVFRLHKSNPPVQRQCKRWRWQNWPASSGICLSDSKTRRSIWNSWPALYSSHGKRLVCCRNAKEEKKNKFYFSIKFFKTFIKFY